MDNEKQRKTFLSYSRTNKDFAIRLAKELKSEGFNIWLDQLDIPAGARWDREVERALKESEIFMIILTPASVDSENVLDEIGYAIDNRKRFLPVLLENCDVPLRLRRFQYVDFTTKNFDDGVESAKELLRSLIAQTTIPRGEIPAQPQDQTAQAEADRKTKEDAERSAKRVADEVLATKAKADREAKAEAERKAKEEADRLAAEKVGVNRLAKQKGEDERLSKAKADREAKAEAERKAKEEADRIAAQKNEADRLAKQKAEDERLAKVKADREAKAEAERKAKEKATPVEAMPAEMKTEPVSAAPTQKKPVPMGLVIGIGAVVVLAMAGIGISMLRKSPAATPTQVPVVSNPVTEAPVVANPATDPPAQSAASGKIQIRWFIGLGTSPDPNQTPPEQSVVDDFNNSQDRIELILEVVPNDKAIDTLANEFASGNGPDIVGPAGFYSFNSFHGQWLDLSPYINETGFDTSIFEPALVDYYRTDEGQVSLPFGVHPAATYYNTTLFDEAGLSYPPSHYGERYVLDGNTVDWNWDTLSEVAKRLTVDANGKNSTESGFDRDRIVQVGFDFQWVYSVNYLGTLRAGSASIVQNNQSIIPDSWREANRWYYNGMWGAQPFIATSALANTAEFGNGNVFNSGKEAMTIVPVWYTCCLTDFANAGHEFQVGVLPLGDDGQVHERIDDISFRVWKDTQHPREAFEVFSYLITTGGDKLLPLYGTMSAIASKNQIYFDGKTQTYPFVKPESWDVFQASLAYLGIPGAEQYQPNFADAMGREQTFSDLLKNNSPSQIDFDTEWQRMVDDLNAIYNK